MILTSMYLFFLSHEHLGSFGICKNDTNVLANDEESETELCPNEKSSNVQGAEIFGTLKSGWPACQGILTFTNSTSEEKVYVVRSRINCNCINVIVKYLKI